MAAKNGKPERSNRVDPFDAIRQIARELSTLSGGRKPAHLLNLSLATAKYLLLYGESDNIRLAALKLVLELPAVKAAAGNLRVAPPRVRELHQHVHLPPGGDPQAEKQLQERLQAMISAGGTQAKAALDALTAELGASKPQEPNENP